MCVVEAPLEFFGALQTSSNCLEHADAFKGQVAAISAMTSHEFQIHVFEDPSARRMINAGWPLMLSFVGVMFAWGMAQI